MKPGKYVSQKSDLFKFIWNLQDGTCLCIRTKRLTRLPYGRSAIRGGRSVGKGRDEFQKRFVSMWWLGDELQTVRWWWADSQPYKITWSHFYEDSPCFGPWLADSPPVTSGQSVGRRKLTGKITSGGSGHGFECRLFLWVSKDIKNWFKVRYLTCIRCFEL